MVIKRCLDFSLKLGGKLRATLSTQPGLSGKFYFESQIQGTNGWQSVCNMSERGLWCSKNLCSGVPEGFW